jgi:hypothetical protein
MRTHENELQRAKSTFKNIQILFYVLLMKWISEALVVMIISYILITLLVWIKEKYNEIF